jgi:hypothetical protein
MSLSHTSGFARSPAAVAPDDHLGLAIFPSAALAIASPFRYRHRLIDDFVRAAAPGRPFADADRTILTDLQGPSHGRSQKKNIALAAWHASLG